MWDSLSYSLPPSFNTHTHAHTRTHTRTDTNAYTLTHTHTHTPHTHTHTPFTAPYIKLYTFQTSNKRTRWLLWEPSLSCCVAITRHETHTLQNKQCFSSPNFPPKHTFIGHGTLK
ncbi:hypothetical protein EYF80_037305 [Liparis tanakae]|uniref:Uncharacterized protein n=1 Tax=Liparis tanakae TaxID=230148 RepID=A0A4Z2GG10_9TELE|nr:hypothetical protein EYF80_037305 [Liparis tanakae]